MEMSATATSLNDVTEMQATLVNISFSTTPYIMSVLYIVAIPCIISILYIISISYVMDIYLRFQGLLCELYLMDIMCTWL